MEEQNCKTPNIIRCTMETKKIDIQKLIKQKKSICNYSMRVKAFPRISKLLLERQSSKSCDSHQKSESFTNALFTLSTEKVSRKMGIENLKSKKEEKSDTRAYSLRSFIL